MLSRTSSRQVGCTGKQEFLVTVYNSLVLEASFSIFLDQPLDIRARDGKIGHSNGRTTDEKSLLKLGQALARHGGELCLQDSKRSLDFSTRPAFGFPALIVTYSSRNTAG